MDTIEHFSDFLRKIWAPNFLAIGIVIIVIWLLISGFVKGLKRRRRNNEPENHNEPPSQE
jgi:Na+/H+ antiporter NhaD/arsenite permease-like protein